MGKRLNIIALGFLFAAPCFAPQACFAQTPPQLDMFGNMTGLTCPASASWIDTTVSSGAITGSLSPQTITLSNATGVAIGNWLTVDHGAAPVQVTGEALGSITTSQQQYKVVLAHGSYIPGTAVLKVGGVIVAYDQGRLTSPPLAGQMQTGILTDAGLVTTGTTFGVMQPASGSSADTTPYENFMSIQYADPIPSNDHTAVQEFINIVFTPAFANSAINSGLQITIDYKYSPAEMFVVQNVSGSNITGVIMNNHAANAPVTQGTWYFAKVTVGATSTWVQCDPLGFGNDQFALYAIGQDGTSSHMSETVNTTAATAITTTEVPTTVTPVSMAGICNLCYITFDQGISGKEETEQVSNVTGSTFQFTPSNTHAANYTIQGYYYNAVAFGTCVPSLGCNGNGGLGGTSGGKYYGNIAFQGPMQIVRARGWGYNVVQAFNDSRSVALDTVNGGGTVPWPTADHSNIAKMPFMITNDVTYYGSYNSGNYNNSSLTGCGGGITPGVTGANGDIDYANKNIWTTWNGVSTGANPGGFYGGAGFSDLYDTNLYAYLCGWIKGGFGGSSTFSNNHENPWLMGLQEDEGDRINSFTNSKRTGFTAFDGTYEDFGSRKDMFMPYHISVSSAGNGSYVAFANNLNNTKAAMIAALQAEYGTIAALNSAWGSTYDNFGTDGRQVTGIALSPTPNGTATTFTVTLAHPPDPESIQLFSSTGATLAGDLPGGGKSSGYSAGTFQGSALICSSSVNYSTGALSATFCSAPATGAALTTAYWWGGSGVGHGLADEDGTCPAFSASCATVWGTSATNLQADGNAAFQADMATLLGNLVSNFSSNEKTQYRALMPHTPIVSDYALGGHGVPSDPVVYQNYAPNVDAIASGGFDPASTNSGGVGPQGIGPYQYVNDYAGDKPELTWAGLPAVADSVMNIKGCNTTVASSGLFSANTQALRAAGYGSWITQLGVKGTYTGTNTFTGINTWQFSDNYSECGDPYDGGNWGMVSAEDNPYDGVHDTTGTTPEYIGNNAFAPTPELHNYGDLIDPVRIDIVNQENLLLTGSPAQPIVPTGRQPMLTLGHARKKDGTVVLVGGNR